MSSMFWSGRRPSVSVGRRVGAKGGFFQYPLVDNDCAIEGDTRIRSRVRQY